MRIQPARACDPPQYRSEIEFQGDYELDVNRGGRKRSAIERSPTSPAADSGRRQHDECLDDPALDGRPGEFEHPRRVAVAYGRVAVAT